MKVDTSEIDKETNVIQFDKTRLPIEIKEEAGFCAHRNVKADKVNRMLECAKCGQLIEPFDFIWEWAIRDRNLHFTREAMKKDIERLTKTLKDLKRDEVNTRARVKRLIS